MSELGGPSGKLFRFVSCVRARGAYVRSDLGENDGLGVFPFPFWLREVLLFLVRRPRQGSLLGPPLGGVGGIVVGCPLGAGGFWCISGPQNMQKH